MTKLVDCPSCGGLLPAGSRCCPHCRCHYSPWRRLVLLVGAALGVSGCGGTNIVHYGPSPPLQDMAVQVPADLAREEHD